MTEPTRDRSGDEELRARFADLRDEVACSTPSFAAMLERAQARQQPELGVIDGGAARPRRRVLAVGAWASAAIAATVAGLLLFDGDLTTRSADDEFADLVAAYSQDMSAGAWRSPTSSLLDVPGMELVRGVPSLGLPAVGLDVAGAGARSGGVR